MSYKLQQGAEIFLLGDWIQKGYFAEWNGIELILKTVD
jgi:hypothetical protein